ILLFPMQVQFQQLLQMVGVLGIGGTLLIGFQFSVITYPSQGIRRFINETWVARQGTPLPQETLTLLWSLVVSLYCLGGLVGCLGSSPLARRIGKKKTLMFNDVTIVAAALLLGFSRMANSFEMVMMGRFIYGFSAGICLNIQGPFLSEVSPEKFRGFAAASTSVFLSLGKALGQIMGLRYKHYNQHNVICFPFLFPFSIPILFSFSFSSFSMHFSKL
uniref:Major facilitator superfamily (MFS) profile domain-containing protein n=1 Tax=Salvator merianae TaxID=96440 RepID=A0A8D0DVY2_SALMN